MRYAEYRPPPALDRFVECVWLVEEDVAGPRTIERILPDGCMELIVHLRDPFIRWTAPDRRETQARGFVVGQMTRFLLIEPGERVRTLGIRFRPGGAHPFLDVPLHELADDMVQIGDLLGSAGRTLEERLCEARDDCQRVDVAFAFLADRLARGRAADTRVRVVIQEVLRTRGEAAVASLAQRVGWSPRQLERRFRSEVGLSPKAFSRIIRLQSVLLALGTKPSPAWASLALEGGYFDQAHMIRDFKEFSGEAPRSLLAEGGTLARHFTSPERLAALFETSR